MNCTALAVTNDTDHVGGAVDLMMPKHPDRQLGCIAWIDLDPQATDALEAPNQLSANKLSKLLLRA